MTKSINAIQDDIIEEFSKFDDWMDKYEYLIALGKTLPQMDPAMKTETFSVPGCQSRVWVAIDIVDGKVMIRADSDTHINRGFIALILRILNARTIKEITDADLYFIQKSGLRSNLLPSRASGLLVFINHIRKSVASL
ncbi:MAG: SufE family protein [Candidatus Neomarinimicrobiota bacterium]|nr:MAG: SufE family protein [Candidatus Neomarinimicrobiota bacterium]